jgi:hypothetical protein
MLRQKLVPESRSTSIRTSLRLSRLERRAKVSTVRAALTPTRAPTTLVTHRYEEQIAGRTYHIEVRAVSDSRWRAQIARMPGMPTSMMPFYGPTPEQAAQQLSRWLAVVYNGSIKQ